MIITSSMDVGSERLQKLEPTPTEKIIKILTQLLQNTPRNFSLTNTGFASV
jgi:hypothetical protein